MDITYNLSEINEDKFFQNEEKSSKIINKQNNFDLLPEKLIKDEFDFGESLELSKIVQNEQINEKKENESDGNINISLDYSFIKNNDINKKTKENDNKIRTVKTAPLKRLKKEDLDKIPIPIFSCIYCSNEYISFNHFSNEILSKKYLQQKSIFDLKQINDLLFPPKIGRNNINNKLLNIIISNSEYLKDYYKINQIKEYFKLDNFNKLCVNEEINLKKAFKQRFEDNILYFKGNKIINKIPKNSLNNKGLFNTNSLINIFSGLTGFIGKAQIEKINNNATNSNCSLSYFNSVPIKKNRNEIGLIGKGKNRHYMENIIENTNKNIETENTIEEKVKILDYLKENDLKRKINKNDIEWENDYYDINNPIISDINLEDNCINDLYDLKGNNNKDLFNTIDNNRINNNKHCYINSENNINVINTKKDLLNGEFHFFNNNKSQISTNTSSNIILKNSVRDKENKSLSSFIKGNKILNIQNNNSTLNPISCNIKIKNKLASLDSIKNKNEKNLNYSNRTPSLTKTRIIDLNTNSEKKLNNHGKSSINLKNIHKKILFNYTANIKKDFIDNNIFSKIKNVFQINKNTNTLENNTLYNLNKKFYPININDDRNEINKKYNKYNLLLTKQNNDIIYNNTLFNKTGNGLKFNKEKKKNNCNFNFLLKVRNNLEYYPFKQQIDCNKQSSIFDHNNIVSIRNFDNENLYNNIKIKDFNNNLRSLDKGNKKRKNNNIHKINESAKKAKLSLPQKLFQEKDGIRKNEIAKSSIKIGNLNYV